MSWTTIACTVVLTICVLAPFGNCRHLVSEGQQPLVDATDLAAAAAGLTHGHVSIRRAANPQLAFADPSSFVVRQNADQRRSRLYIGKRTRSQTAAFEAPDADDVDALSDVGAAAAATDADGNTGLSREQWVDRFLTRDPQLTVAGTAGKRQMAGDRCA